MNKTTRLATAVVAGGVLGVGALAVVAPAFAGAGSAGQPAATASWAGHGPMGPSSGMGSWSGNGLNGVVQGPERGPRRLGGTRVVVSPGDAAHFQDLVKTVGRSPG